MTITMRILLSIRDHDSDQILEKNQLTLMSISNGDPVEDPDQDSTFRTVTPRFAFDQTQQGRIRSSVDHLVALLVRTLHLDCTTSLGAFV